MIPAYTKTIKQGGTTLTPIKPTLQRDGRYSQHTEYQIIVGEQYFASARWLYPIVGRAQSIAPLRFTCKWLWFTGLHPSHTKGMSLQADGI